jgi:formate hydrogenlyase transcriptional activator
LIEHFVQKFAKQQGKAIDHIPGEAMEMLQRHDWPGNIRELQNVIERAVIMSAGPALDLQMPGYRTRTVGSAPIRTLADAEREHIIATLRASNWVVGGQRGAAALLGLARTTLITMMQRHGITREGIATTSRTLGSTIPNHADRAVACIARHTERGPHLQPIPA